MVQAILFCKGTTLTRYQGKITPDYIYRYSTLNSLTNYLGLVPQSPHKEYVAFQKTWSIAYFNSHLTFVTCYNLFQIRGGFSFLHQGTQQNPLQISNKFFNKVKGIIKVSVNTVQAVVPLYTLKNHNHKLVVKKLKAL